MENVGVKEQLRRLMEKLPDSVSWDDIMQEIFVIQAIEAGLRDSDAGRVLDIEQVKAKFGLPK